MLRTVKYLSLLVVQFIGALLGVGALFIAFYAVSTPLSEFESAGWRILGMAFACGMMFPFVLQASLIQSYMPLPLSMGVTRRGFFAGAQAAKVMLAGGIGVCLLLIQLAVKWMFGVDALFTGTMLVGLFAVLLLGASVGEALGFVSLRFGRVGMIVFFVLIVGGCCDRRTVRNGDPAAYRNGPGQGCAVPAGGQCVCHPTDQRYFSAAAVPLWGRKSQHDLYPDLCRTGCPAGRRRCRDG